MTVISWYWFRLSTILWRGLPWARESGAIHWVYIPKVQIRIMDILSGKSTERSTLDACPVSWRLHLVSQVINWNFLIGKCWDKLSLTLTTYRLASMYAAWLAPHGVRFLNLELLWLLMFPIYEGHLESKERFAIQRYLLIIGKKQNMQVLSHTFTCFST